MKIGGLIKTSLIDYPNKVSAVIFTQGCNFRCPYCHNPELVLPEQYSQLISEEFVFDFLKKRKDVLDGVVITGGEPTLQSDLVAFIRKVKALGFSIKLDTNGSSPDVISSLLKDDLIDFIAMDIKTLLDKYNEVAGINCDMSEIKRSIDIIKASNIDYEFRTTLVPILISENDIQKIKVELNDDKRYRIQPFVKVKKLVDTQKFTD